MSGSDPAERFLAHLAESLGDGSFTKLMLTGPRKAAAGPDPDAEPGLQRVLVRRVVLKGIHHLSLVFRHATRDVTKNLALAAGQQQIRQWLGLSFKNAHLTTRREELQLVFNKKGVPHLSRKALVTLVGSDGGPDGGCDGGPAGQSIRAPDDAHDRARQRWVDPKAPFLRALGVTDAQHRIVPAMARKWRQINKFVEIFAGAMTSVAVHAGDPPLRVADFGSGKGYLTFAVHDWLAQTQAGPVQVTGVEQRPDMVGLGNDVVAALGLQGLRFEEGDLRSWQPAALDVVIALHACDTATDHAIHLGVRAGAKVILCAPCCHKELRPQLLSPHPLRPLLQHGVHQAQQAEMLTDGLRAMLLDICGYDTQVFEFVALEHTQKNKMILAIRRPQLRATDPLLAQVGELKQFYGIRDHCLEVLLRADGLLGPDSARAGALRSAPVSAATQAAGPESAA